MKKINQTVESVVSKAVNHMIDTELYGWPPQCASFLYQPVRPRKGNKNAPKISSKVHK